MRGDTNISQIRTADKETLKNLSKQALDGYFGADTQNVKKAIWEKIKELKS